MNQSLRIGSVFGITVRLHAMFLVMLAVIMLKFGATFALALIPAIFLHELGHSLMAKRHNVQVLDITFMWYGGVARMRELPQDWRVESQIAFAGPAVNFILAALVAPIALVFGGYAASTFLSINLFLGVFNLIPAFPLDGARVLRALLARKLDWVGATERTASIGRGIATVILFGGMAVTLPFFNLFGCFWSFMLAGATWWSSTQEVIAVRMRGMRSAFEGGGQSSPFGPFGPFATAQQGPAEEADRSPEAADAGFSSKDIEDLESFRGSLRNRKSDS